MQGGTGKGTRIVEEPGAPYRKTENFVLAVWWLLLDYSVEVGGEYVRRSLVEEAPVVVVDEISHR